jgi:hypothetical protein
MSVGGALAVGGVGGTTSTYGVMSDNVIELEREYDPFGVLTPGYEIF